MLIITFNVLFDVWCLIISSSHQTINRMADRLIKQGEGKIMENNYYLNFMCKHSHNYIISMCTSHRWKFDSLKNRTQHFVGWFILLSVGEGWYNVNHVLYSNHYINIIYLSFCFNSTLIIDNLLVLTINWRPDLFLWRQFEIVIYFFILLFNIPFYKFIIAIAPLTFEIRLFLIVVVCLWIIYYDSRDAWSNKLSYLSSFVLTRHDIVVISIYQ